MFSNQQKYDAPAPTECNLDKMVIFKDIENGTNGEVMKIEIYHGRWIKDLIYMEQKDEDKLRDFLNHRAATR